LILPLSDIRVLAVEHAVAAPLCTRHLADLGADVVKIERPGGGDFARDYDSVVNGQSAYFVWLNQGKRSVVLNLKEESGWATFESLADTSDVLVHNLGPAAAENLGLVWGRLHERWPNLIVCAISGYGENGPYRDHKAYDLLLQGESGLLSLTGTPESPAKVGISIADISAGMYALASVLASLYERKRNDSGGRFIDVSMLECIAEWMMASVYHEIYAGQAPPRTGLRHNMIVPYGPFATKDGPVNIAVQTSQQWKRFCEIVILKPELLSDKRFSTNEGRVLDRAHLEPIIEAVVAKLSRADLLGRLDAADIPSGAINSVADLLQHPQLQARGRWREVPSPYGKVRAIHHPMNISGLERTTGEIPALGQDTDTFVT
jgi:itaconate CoA-transferase